tara:strand:+ start:128 stop:475 length:348 start_codon:yes stop_codon:yes gene_type:complete
MNTETIKTELQEYIIEEMQNYDFGIREVEDLDLNDLHHELFNQDYYLIGYYKCEQWLKNHNINIFEGINFVQDYERMNFGEFKQYKNAEELVNMIVYIIGEEILYNAKEYNVLPV